MFTSLNRVNYIPCSHHKPVRAVPARARSSTAGARLVVRATGQLKVVFVSPEVAPWSKVGGLGDVLAALPKALAARGHKVMTVAPRYASYHDIHDTGVRAPVVLPTVGTAAQGGDACGPATMPAAAQSAAGVMAPLRGCVELPAAGSGAGTAAVASTFVQLQPDTSLVGFYMSSLDGVDRVFVDHPIYQAQPIDDRSPQWVGSYCEPEHGQGDLAARYSILCQAALAAPCLLWGSTGGSAQNAWHTPPVHAPEQLAVGCSAVQQYNQGVPEFPRQIVNGIAMSAYAEALPSTGVDPTPVWRRAAARSAAAVASPAAAAATATGARPQLPSILSAAELGAAEDSNEAMSDGDAIVFVGNDWACGLLPLWLRHYEERSGEDRVATQARAGTPPPTSEASGGQTGSPAVATDTEVGSSGDSMGAGGKADPLGGVSTVAQQITGLSTRQHAGISEDAELPLSRSNSINASPTSSGSWEVTQVHFGQSTLGGSGWGSVWGRRLQRQRKQQQQQRHGRSRVMLGTDQPLHKGSGAGIPPHKTRDVYTQTSSTKLRRLGRADSNIDTSAAVSGESPAAIVTIRAVQPTMPQPSEEHTQPSKRWRPSAAPTHAVSDTMQSAASPSTGNHRPHGTVRSTLPLHVAAPGRRQPQQGQQNYKQQKPWLRLKLRKKPRQLSAVLLQARSRPRRLARTKQQQQQQQQPEQLQEWASLGDTPQDAAAETSRSDLTDHDQAMARGLRGAKVALAVHSFDYHGRFPVDVFPRLGLPPGFLRWLVNPLDQVAAGIKSSIQQATGAVQDRMQGAISSMATWSRSRPWLDPLLHDSRAQHQQQQQQLGPASSTRDQAGGADAAVTPPSPALQLLLSAVPLQTLATAETQPRLKKELRDSEVASTSAATAADAATAAAAGELDWLCAGLACSDLLLTVSKSYAEEVLVDLSRTDEHVQALLRARGISAITNGIDTQTWDPSTDAYLPRRVRYSAATAAEGKAAAKALLQSRLGLDIAADVPLFAYIGRLEQEKGADVILAALPSLLGRSDDTSVNGQLPSELGTEQSAVDDSSSCSSGGGSSVMERTAMLADAASSTTADGYPGPLTSGDAAEQSSADLDAGGTAAPAVAPPDANREAVAASIPAAAPARTVLQPAAASRSSPMQLVMLGRGRRWMESGLESLEGLYPGVAKGVVHFNEPLAHLILAAADYVIMPSRSEPCGLVAACGMRYGAVPLVAPVGGLRELVTPGSTGLVMPEAVGSQDSSIDFRNAVRGLVQVVQCAQQAYGTNEMAAMRERCMQRDASWEQPAAMWERALQQLVSGEGSLKK